MFDEAKAAQMAVYFLMKTEEGSMDKIKLMKLLYLAERESLVRYGSPMSGDRLYSLPHGPILSTTLNLANGKMKTSVENGWSAFITSSKVEEHDLSLIDRSVNEDDLDELSRSDREILEDVWQKFGHKDKWDVKDYTHNLPEWKDSGNSRQPIEYEDIFKAAGYKEADIQAIIEQIEIGDAIDRMFPPS